MNSKKEGIKKQIKAFGSFEEMENDQLAYYASLKPHELLMNHKKLSMAAYGLKAEPRMNKRKRQIKPGKPE